METYTYCINADVMGKLKQVCELYDWSKVTAFVVGIQTGEQILRQIEEYPDVNGVTFAGSGYALKERILAFSRKGFLSFDLHPNTLEIIARHKQPHEINSDAAVDRLLLQGLEGLIAAAGDNFFVLRITCAIGTESIKFNLPSLPPPQH